MSNWRGHRKSELREKVTFSRLTAFKSFLHLSSRFGSGESPVETLDCQHNTQGERGSPKESPRSQIETSGPICVGLLRVLSRAWWPVVSNVTVVVVSACDRNSVVSSIFATRAGHCTDCDLPRGPALLRQAKTMFAPNKRNTTRCKCERAQVAPRNPDRRTPGHWNGRVHEKRDIRIASYGQCFPIERTCKSL
jgi:hypothetical protein